jgi:hypothetical protein
MGRTIQKLVWMFASLGPLGLSWPAVVLAQQPLATGTTDGPICELHVWPAQDFHAVQYGWTHGGTVDGSMKGRKGYKPLAYDTLSTARQVESLNARALAELLELPNFRTIIHAASLPRSTIRNATERHAKEAPECYAELVVDSVVFQKNILGGNGLNVLFRFRQFAGKGAPVRSLTTFIVQPVRAQARSAHDSDGTELSTALIDAFNRDIIEFGQRLKLSAPGRKRR